MQLYSDVKKDVKTWDTALHIANGKMEFKEEKEKLFV